MPGAGVVSDSDKLADADRSLAERKGWDMNEGLFVTKLTPKTRPMRK